MTPRTSNYDHLALLRPVHVDDLLRIGRSGDGGYVVQRAVLDVAEVLVGFGINDDWSFESAVVDQWPGVRLVGVDGSVSVSDFKWQARQAMSSALFALARGNRQSARSLYREGRHRYAIARAFRRFWAQPNREFIHEFLTYRPGFALTWTEMRTGGGVLAGVRKPNSIFVKMDVEGAEYRVLPELAADAAVIGGMVLEFHECDYLREQLAECLAALRPSFAVVHVHGNNAEPLAPGAPCSPLVEVTLTNRSLLPAALERSRRQYPVTGLDQPNDPRHKDVVLDFLNS